MGDFSKENEKLKTELTEKDRSLRGIQQAQLRSTFGEKAASLVSPGGSNTDDTLRQLLAEAQQVYQSIRESAGSQLEEVELQQMAEASAEAATTKKGKGASAEAVPSRAYMKTAAPTRFGGQSLAEQTLSSVQAAFNRRQLQVQELSTKLNAARENMQHAKRYYA